MSWRKFMDRDWKKLWDDNPWIGFVGYFIMVVIIGRICLYLLPGESGPILKGEYAQRVFVSLMMGLMWPFSVPITIIGFGIFIVGKFLIFLITA